MIRGTAAVALTVVVAVGGGGQASVLAWYSFNSAGRPCVMPGQKLSCTMAQPVQGIGTTTDLRGYWGFWYGIGATGGVADAPRPARTSLAVVPSVLTQGRAILRYSLPGPEPASVTLFDATGRAALTKKVPPSRSGALPLDLRRLSSGVYLVRLEGADCAAAQKLVVR